MSGYRGRNSNNDDNNNNNSKSRSGGGGRYFDHHSQPGRQASGGRGRSNGTSQRGSAASTNNRHVRNLPNPSAYVPPPPPGPYRSGHAYVKSDNSGGMFYSQQDPMFVPIQQMQPVQNQQPPPLLVDVELSARPGPNAIRRSFGSPPGQRLSQPSTSSVTDSSHESTKRKAFDAKRFRAHSECETDSGNKSDTVAEDFRESVDVEPRSSREIVNNNNSEPAVDNSGMGQAIEKAELHLSTVRKELSVVTSEIARLTAKQEELKKRESNIEDILSTLKTAVRTPATAVSTNQNRSSPQIAVLPEPSPSSVSKKSSSNAINRARQEVQCPEISTHSIIISPEHLPLHELPETTPPKQPASKRKIDSSAEKTATNSSQTVQRRKEAEQPTRLPTPKNNQQALHQQVTSCSVPMHLLFRDVESGYNSRGAEDESLIITCLSTISGDPNLLLIGSKSGHVYKYSLQRETIVRKELVFKKSVSALCGVSPDGEDSRIFAGCIDGDYRCFDGSLSEVYNFKFTWGVTCIKFLLDRIYLGVGNGLVSIICPKGGRVLERFSSGSCYIFDIESLSDSARDTVVCSLKSGDLTVRDARDGLSLRSIDLPRALLNETARSSSSASSKPFNSVGSPACTHLACAGGYIFGCQINGQIIAVAPGDRKAVIVANLDSQPMAMAILGLGSTTGIYLAVITKDAMIRVFLVSSNMPVGAVLSKKKRHMGKNASKSSRMSSSSDDEQTESMQPFTFCQVFQESRATKDWKLDMAQVLSSGAVCLIQSKLSSSSQFSSPWILEVYLLPKMLMSEMS